MSDQTKQQIAAAARDLLARHPLRRGPWLVSERDLQMCMKYNGTEEQLSNALRMTAARGGQAGAIAEAALSEIEYLRDKCGELGEELITAVGVAYNAGAVDWVKANYPDFPSPTAIAEHAERGCPD